MSDEALVERLSLEKRVLCIVNSRKQAQDIYSLLPDGDKFHLSTTMTPSHRRKALDDIRQRLDAGLPCRVVSTSLIEAGVDVDFPCVYRSIAGLDSIIQAAGRCNRERKDTAENSIVHIFDTQAAPPAAIKQNIAAARHVMERFEDMASPEAIEAYFSFLLYSLKSQEALDKKNILRLMTEDMAFETISKNFHLIENNTRTVYIPLHEGQALVQELIDSGPSRELMRALGQYSVSVYEANYQRLYELGALNPIFENAAILLNTNYYDENTGLSLSPEGGKALFG